jgi:molecular chaperone DnaK (HSP70)
MDKWADYLISEVSYTPQRLISNVIRHKDTNTGIADGAPVDRITLISDIKHGLSHFTIYSNKDSWKKGDKIKIFSIDGNYYLRIDKNKVALDYLGSLPEMPPSKPKPSEPKPSKPKSTESKISKGVLPKQSSDELPQELDLVPDSDEATPEQLLRLEQLEQQIKKIESQKTEPKRPKGALPKQSAGELPQELDLVPESKSDKATPEQLLRLKKLEKQIKKLESKISKDVR